MILAWWVGAALADEPQLEQDLDREAAIAPAPEAILAARAFTLTTPYASAWRADHPVVTRGRLVAVRVPAAYAVIRDVGSPVLYADDRPAEVLARRAACWVVVGPEAPLDRVVWTFGPDTLPERVTAADGARVRAAAVARGATPLAPAKVRPDLALADAEALARAGEALAAEVCR